MQGPQGKYPAIKAGDYVKQAFKPQFDAKQVRSTAAWFVCPACCVVCKPRNMQPCCLTCMLWSVGVVN